MVLKLGFYFIFNLFLKTQLLLKPNYYEKTKSIKKSV